jgi:hypothetical protein
MLVCGSSCINHLGLCVSLTHSVLLAESVAFTEESNICCSLSVLVGPDFNVPGLGLWHAFILELLLRQQR